MRIIFGQYTKTRFCASYMGSQGERKPHAVCIAYPAQGHIKPMMLLAKLLHSKGFHITFVNTEFNQKRLSRSTPSGSLNSFEDFRFESIPDGLPPSDNDATQDVPALSYSTQRNFLAPFRNLVIKLNTSSPDDAPLVTCIVSDGVTFTQQAADELGIPEILFWTSSACGFMACLHYPELIERGYVPRKDESYLTSGYLNTHIDWMPGMPNVRLKDMPSFIRTTDPHDIMFNFLKDEAQNNFKASALILNTFYELELEVINAIKSKYGEFYTIGPLHTLCSNLPETSLKSLGTSLWKEDKDCLKWLDKWESGSVVHVNFGSITVMTNQRLTEAWGLANSKKPFLWVIRPDLVIGESAILPKEFSAETRERGLITSWCPQDEVLSHASVGVFLTQCGWNSTLESICVGVPVICWPFFGERPNNCRYACNEWRIGMEIDNDVKRDEVVSLVRETMEGDKGKEMRVRASKWKEMGMNALEDSGSSYVNFSSLVKDVLLNKGRQSRCS